MRRPHALPAARAPAVVGTAVVAALMAAVVAAPAAAQEYSRFLRCSGELAAGGQTRPAHVDFALRANNRTALIEGSNVLPVGDRLHFVPTPGRYAMTFRLPRQGTQVLALPGWWSSTILVFFPDLERLNQIRLSIDRQTGALEGELLNEQDKPLGRLAMQCQPRVHDDAPPRM